MLALAEYRAGLCPSCGLPISECTAAGSEDSYRAEARRCHATTARLQEAERYAKSPHPDALLYSVKPRSSPR